MKSEADDATIVLLKSQYDQISGGMESLIEDHRRIERNLTVEIHNTRAADKEIAGLLNQVADLILLAARARIGNDTPATMPENLGPHINDARLPMIGPN